MSLCKIKITLSILSLVVLGCASSGVEVQTTPEPGDVYMYSSNGEKKNLGPAPVTIPVKDLKAIDGDLIHLGVEKEGFVKEQLYINKANFGVNASITVKMTPLANWNKVYQDDQANKYLAEVARLAAEIQSATVKRELGRAEQLAKTMVDQFPKLEVAWNLLGNIYYLQKRASDALNAYNKAVALNPSSVEAKNMINKLRGINF
tara:strand:- start:96298 stop:96909 length:612 start_codon:yes stop_codon:yes gene_type:complete